MQYAEVDSSLRKGALIVLELSNWGELYQKLFDQTDASGWEAWVAYSHKNFNNPFQQADEARYQARKAWAEILRDIVREGGRGEDDKGRLDVQYISHARTEWERTHDGIWAPKNGWYVPTVDGIFHEGTLIPFETVQDKKEAIKRLEAKGIPPEQVSFSYRLNRYRNDERFVGRGFDPDRHGGGRFGVDAYRLPSNSGLDGVASRPAYDKPEIVMKAAEPIAASR